MKVHIISGFLGSGKTTLINKWLPALHGQVCIIENEFGDVSIDDYLFPQKYKIKEIHSGCICCSLKGNLSEAILEMNEKYSPDHLIIEPSGVACLSQILSSCKKIVNKINVAIGNVCTIVDLRVFSDYIENFGYFYSDQITSTPLIFLSNISSSSNKLTQEAIKKMNALNPNAKLVTEKWRNASPYLIDSFLSLGEISTDSKKNKSSVPSADQVLESFSIDSPRILTKDEFLYYFENIENFSSEKLLRVKGFIKLIENKKLYFNYTPYHKEWTYIDNDISTGIVFIGKDINKESIKSSFGNKACLSNFKVVKNEVNRL